jgi:uncharacterized protein
MRYKESKYNYIKQVADKVYIYNLLTRSFLQLNSKKWDLMRSNLFECNSEKDNSLLNKYGVIVPESVDEFNILHDTIQQQINTGRDITIFLSMTSLCNFSCKYCYQDYRPECGGNSYISKEHLDELFKYVRAEIIKNRPQYFNVVYFGGEPTLDEEKLLYALNGFESIEGVSKNHSLITNGYLLTDKIIDAFSKISNPMIQVTIDGTEANHNNLRPLKSGDGTYKKIIDNLNKCCELMPKKVYLRENVSEDSIDDYYVFFSDLKKRIDVNDLGGISINGIFSGQKGTCDKPLMSSKLLELIKYGIREGLPITYPSEYGPCLAHSRTGVAIDEELKAYVCPGALYQHSIGEIHEGRLVISDNNWYEKINDIAKCVEKCKYAPICYGGCKLSGGCKKKDIEMILPTVMEQKISKYAGKE